MRSALELFLWAIFKMKAPILKYLKTPVHSDSAHLSGSRRYVNNEGQGRIYIVLNSVAASPTYCERFRKLFWLAKPLFGTRNRYLFDSELGQKRGKFTVIVLVFTLFCQDHRSSWQWRNLIRELIQLQWNTYCWFFKRFSASSTSSAALRNLKPLKISLSTNLKRFVLITSKKNFNLIWIQMFSLHGTSQRGFQRDIALFWTMESRVSTLRCTIPPSLLSRDSTETTDSDSTITYFVRMAGLLLSSLAANLNRNICRRW